ncbi:hypothetical protein [Streptomyces sp. SCL15-4]|uniref:hypothetical protein n=1 Tax=Streptomyces sp. SCL15-4 TaxID=2967221 RepID=UPI002966F048|nr:hypothetical protein [Streptomyces sp. SCL15-4]
MSDKLTECRVCGAAVANYARHNTWHEALKNVLPSLEREVERVAAQKKAEGPGRFRPI